MSPSFLDGDIIGFVHTVGNHSCQLMVWGLGMYQYFIQCSRRHTDNAAYVLGTECPCETRRAITISVPMICVWVVPAPKTSGALGKVIQRGRTNTCKSRRNDEPQQYDGGIMIIKVNEAAAITLGPID